MQRRKEVMWIPSRPHHSLTQKIHHYAGNGTVKTRRQRVGNLYRNLMICEHQKNQIALEAQYPSPKTLAELGPRGYNDPRRDIETVGVYHDLLG